MTKAAKTKRKKGTRTVVYTLRLTRSRADRESAERLAACFNACRGDATVVHDLLAALEAARDALWAIRERIRHGAPVATLDEYDTHMGDIRCDVSAAIAKAKGGAR